MKINERNAEITGTLEFSEEVPMTVDPSALHIIIKSIIDTYSNPYTATLRELTSNAWDSHKISGQTRPVEVTLPTLLNPNLVVRDWGVGLTRDEMKTVYQFGTSTKRDSNDYIGSFGLGSKAGLAMASSYTVRAVKDGKRNVAVIGRNEESHPYLNFFPESDTDEPNGVTVTVPTSETEKFEKALRSETFFAGWGIEAVKIDGKFPRFSVYNPEQFQPLTGVGWVYTETDGPKIGNTQTGTAMVGPIMYKIDWSQFSLPENIRDDYLANIILDLPIGSIDLPMNRETLIYGKRTRTAIESAVSGAVEAAKGAYAKRIDAAETFRDAMVIRKAAVSAGFVEDFTYKGQSMTPKLHPRPPYNSAPVPVTDYAVTQAIPTEGWRTNPADGTQITYLLTSKSQRNLYYNVNDIIWLASTKHSVLVTDAGSMSRNRDGTFHIAARATVPFTRALADQGFAPVPDKITVFFMTAEEKDIDPVMVKSFEKVVTREAFEKVADDYKKEQMRLARLARGPRDTAPTVPAPVTTVSFDYNYWASRTRTMPELDATQKYIVIDNDSGFLMQKARQVLTTKRGMHSQSQVHRVLYILKDSYTFIISKRGLKLDVLAAQVPNIVKLEDAIVAEIDRMYSGMGVLGREMAVADRAGQYPFWFSRVSPHYQALILDTEVRDRIAAGPKSVYVSTMDDIQRLLNSGVTVDKSKYPFPKTVADPLDRYPLLGTASISTATVPDAVEYINLMYTARQKQKVLTSAV